MCDAQGLCTCWTNSTPAQPPACYSPAAYTCVGGQELLSGPDPLGSCFISSNNSSSNTQTSTAPPSRSSSRQPDVSSMDTAAPDQAQLNHPDHATANMRSPSPRTCTLWQQLLFEILLCADTRLKTSEQWLTDLLCVRAVAGSPRPPLVPQLFKSCDAVQKALCCHGPLPTPALCSVRRTKPLHLLERCYSDTAASLLQPSAVQLPRRCIATAWPRAQWDLQCATAPYRTA